MNLLMLMNVSHFSIKDTKSLIQSYYKFKATYILYIEMIKFSWKVNLRECGHHESLAESIIFGTGYNFANSVLNLRIL